MNANGELNREVIGLRGRVRKLERDQKMIKKVLEAALKELAVLQDKPWEPIEFLMDSKKK